MRCGRVNTNRQRGDFRKVEVEDLLRDDAGAVEGVVEPEVGGEGMVGGDGNDTVFEEVVGGRPRMRTDLTRTS